MQNLRLLLALLALALCPPALAADSAGTPASPPLVPARVGEVRGAGPAATAPATAPAAALLRSDGGRHVLTATGREPHPGRDVATFAGIETDAPNFTFTARLAADGPDLPPGAKAGITVRAGLAGPEKAVHLRYDAHDANRCLQWIMRYHVSPDSHDGSHRAVVSGTNAAFARSQGLWLRVVRRYPYVDLLASTDGTDWRPAADYRPVLLPQKVWVGLQLTAGGAVGSGRVLDAAYDNVSFTVDPTDAGTETRAAYKEYTPPVGTWRMHVVTVGKAKNEASAFLLMPKDMDPRSIRAILYTAGSKEEVVRGKPLDFEKEGGKRRPVGMTAWEGSTDIEGIRPFNAMLAHYGLVRVGGYFPPELYDEAVRKLAEASGIKFLPNVPFVVTGASFAGGMSARAAALYPERCIASAPVIIGMAGSETTDPRVLAVPHLHVFGTRDGGHLGDAAKALPMLRNKHALWGSAPMWQVYHRQHKADAVIYPFFLEAMRLRLPERPDYAAGPVALKPLREADGWLGLVDEGWQSPRSAPATAAAATRPGPATGAATQPATRPVLAPEVNLPRVVPFAEMSAARDAAWLPSERVARVWQAFASNNPRTVIHFPTFEGRETYGGVSPHGWHNSSLAAGEPFELVASGPAGPGVTVEYFDAGERLKVRGARTGNPFRVTLEGLEPGLHAIYAVTTTPDGKREVSRPVTVFFQKRG